MRGMGMNFKTPSQNLKTGWKRSLYLRGEARPSGKKKKGKCLYLWRGKMVNVWQSESGRGNTPFLGKLEDHAKSYTHVAVRMTRKQIARQKNPHIKPKRRKKNQ